MESEIKAAWKKGFRAALQTFSEIDEDRHEVLAEEGWDQQGQPQMSLAKDWNTRRIAHRDEG